MKKILIGIGDSKFADNATKYGFDLARKLQANVGLIHITEPTAMGTPIATTDTSMGMPFEEPMNLVMPELMHIQDEQSKRLVNDAIKNYGNDVQVTVFSEYGDTAEGILACAKKFEAEMIIIGTHSRSGIDRFLMGSVAEDVVRNSEIPVLVVPMVESH
jgi:nucleotide-binding universal stress UspA family protein